MENRGSRDSKRVLKTATSVADPVLMRLHATGGTLVVLAEDMQYDRAGVMHLRGVRWVRARGRSVRSLLLKPRPAAGRKQEMTVRRLKGWVECAIRHEGWIEAADNRTHFQFKNISMELYKTYRASAPRRLLAAGNQLAPKKNRLAQAARAVHKVRLALRRALVPKVAI